ncbi:MAG: hypothetical protein Q4F95_05445 [Oscillospiraceae bacterium]|nr:hypothetical protein [Oscillospiraceae bacterium]
MSDYERFRSLYPEFVYHGYDIEETEESIGIRYNFEIRGLSDFNPTWKFIKQDAQSLKNNRTFNKLVFSLGMVELVSYWKVTCSPLVTVKGFSMTQKQISWWKKLYYNGLGEFFYRNQIDADPLTFMNIEASGNDDFSQHDNIPRDLNGCLIPVGGGKDSIVTLDLLSDMVPESCCYLINKRNSIYQSAYTAGYTDGQIVLAQRTLDKNILRLNSEGFLNGHTPFSAIVAFSSVIAAFMNSKKYVVLSNEASANESTVKGSQVNHQYSKSYEFEKDFFEYEKEFIGSEVYYFSMLRPLSEYQIASYFSDLKKYHKIFRSCNVGSKTDSWCSNCSKCLFVCLILSPFLEYEELCEILGSNIADREDMLETFRKLIGLTDEKPFECVGSRDEVNFAAAAAVRKMEEAGKRLPLLFEYYKTTTLYSEYRNKKNDLLEGYNKTNNLPETFKEILFKKCCRKGIIKND